MYIIIFSVAVWNIHVCLCSVEHEYFISTISLRDNWSKKYLPATSRGGRYLVDVGNYFKR